MTKPVRFIHGPCKSHWRPWVRPLSPHENEEHRVRGHCTCTMGRNTGLSWALQCGQPAVAAAWVLPMVGSLAPDRRKGPEIGRFHSPTASRPRLNLWEFKLSGYWLVVSTPLNNISQLGWLLPIYGKIRNVPNHQSTVDISTWVL